MRLLVAGGLTAFAGGYIVLLSLLPLWLCFATLIACPVAMILLVWWVERKPPTEVDDYCAQMDAELEEEEAREVQIRHGAGFRS